MRCCERDARSNSGIYALLRIRLRKYWLLKKEIQLPNLHKTLLYTKETGAEVDTLEMIITPTARPIDVGRLPSSLHAPITTCLPPDIPLVQIREICNRRKH
jgi:hypothetical protein